MCGARCSFSKELHSFGWLAVFVFDLRQVDCNYRVPGCCFASVAVDC